jgi:hypothetical protein
VAPARLCALVPQVVSIGVGSRGTGCAGQRGEDLGRPAVHVSTLTLMLLLALTLQCDQLDRAPAVIDHDSPIGEQHGRIRTIGRRDGYPAGRRATLIPEPADPAERERRVTGLGRQPAPRSQIVAEEVEHGAVEHPATLGGSDDDIPIGERKSRCQPAGGKVAATRGRAGPRIQPHRIRRLAEKGDEQVGGIDPAIDREPAETGNHLH